jgi:hypothetical protein
LPRDDAAVVTVSLELAVPPGATRTLDGVIAAVGEDPTVLEAAETVVENDTLSEKRLNVLTVMIEVADWLARMFRLFGLALRPKSAGVFDILHAVRGCSSHPEKLWAASVRWSGSQKTNPWTSISDLYAAVCATSVLLSQAVNGPQ